MTSSIKDDLKSFRRSWVHHTGMQMATMAVLVSTFAVAAFVMTISMNLNRILSSWGDGVQMTVYLQDDVDSERLSAIRSQLAAMKEFKEILHVPREVATENFKTQMASYAPDLLTDADFSNPFPASIKLSLKSGVASDQEAAKFEALATAIHEIEGVEDVSYGQGWVHNYTSFVSALRAAGGVMALVLLGGSLFVVGNAIRASISARREEIEILELVGATSAMIRRPFVFEGLATGALAAAIALLINFGLHMWQNSVLSSSLVLARLMPMMSFLSVSTILMFFVAGAGVGATGAWLTVRRINDGWSAKQGLEN